MKTRLLFLAILTLECVPRLCAAEPEKWFFGRVAHERGTFTPFRAPMACRWPGIRWWRPISRNSFTTAQPRARKAMIPRRGRERQDRNQRPSAHGDTRDLSSTATRARTMDVEVKFPEGQVTEWYPQDTVADTNIPGGSSARAQGT